MARKKRRAGGSKARREIRQKSEIKNVVTPGLEGGKYNPLSTQEIEKIHLTALNVLENIGIGDPIPEILDHTLAFARGGGFELLADLPKGGIIMIFKVCKHMLNKLKSYMINT